MYSFTFTGRSVNGKSVLLPGLPFIGNHKTAYEEAKRRCDIWEVELELDDDQPSEIIALGRRKGQVSVVIVYPDEELVFREAGLTD